MVKESAHWGDTLLDQDGARESANAQAATRETRRFADLVQSRAARDPDFAAALLREGIGTMLTGDVNTGQEGAP